MTGAREITRALGGRWSNGSGMAFCPAHPNTRTPALSLRDGHDGRLLAHCFAGCSFRDVAMALRRLGLSDGRAGGMRPDPVAAARAKQAETEEREKARCRALNVWSETTPIAGTLAERYLRARAILCGLPASLRFSAACWHGATAQRLPAMVAAVTRQGESKPVGIHRTWLVEPGVKAAVNPVKAMLGPVKGGAVRLSDGDGPLVVAEGIETALSLLDALTPLNPRVWAALSTEGVKGLHLPAEAGDLILAPDGDAAGRAAATALADRATGLGWSVRIMEPPGEGRDWNDVAMDREVAA